MDTVSLRNEIQRAESHEDNTRELASLLSRRLHRPYSTARTVKPSESILPLLAFVRRFVERTPILLDTLFDCTRQSPREDLCEIVINTCLDYFLAPPALLAGRQGLNGALAKSYLCHRLVEELNDCCTVSALPPLIPVDFTCSNLIAHHLIGEPLANLLDEMIGRTVSRLRALSLAELDHSRGKGFEDPLALCHSRNLMDSQLPSLLTMGTPMAPRLIH